MALRIAIPLQRDIFTAKYKKMIFEVSYSTFGNAPNSTERVLQKLMVTQIFKECSGFYGSRKLIALLRRACHWDLCQLMPINIFHYGPCCRRPCMAVSQAVSIYSSFMTKILCLLTGILHKHRIIYSYLELSGNIYSFSPLRS